MLNQTPRKTFSSLKGFYLKDKSVWKVARTIGDRRKQRERIKWKMHMKRWSQTEREAEKIEKEIETK
jgi:hypothetical protein